MPSVSIYSLTGCPTLSRSLSSLYPRQLAVDCKMPRQVAPRVSAIVPPDSSSEGIRYPSKCWRSKGQDESSAVLPPPRSLHSSPPRTNRISWTWRCVDASHTLMLQSQIGAQPWTPSLEAGTHIMRYVKVDVTGVFAHPYFIAGPKGPRDCCTRRSPIV